MTTAIAPSQLTVSAAEAADLTGLARTTIYALVKSGDLEAAHLGRKVLVRWESLRAFIDALPAEGPPS